MLHMVIALVSFWMALVITHNTLDSEERPLQ
jgi:hypothetical protein